MSEQMSQKDYTAVVRAVFDELDMQQRALYRQMSGAQRLQQAFELCDWAPSLIIASIRSQHPTSATPNCRNVFDDVCLGTMSHRACPPSNQGIGWADRIGAADLWHTLSDDYHRLTQMSPLAE